MRSLMSCGPMARMFSATTAVSCSCCSTGRGKSPKLRPLSATPNDRRQRRWTSAPASEAQLAEDLIARDTNGGFSLQYLREIGGESEEQQSWRVSAVGAVKFLSQGATRPDIVRMR